MSEAPRNSGEQGSGGSGSMSPGDIGAAIATNITGPTNAAINNVTGGSIVAQTRAGVDAATGAITSSATRQAISAVVPGALGSSNGSSGSSNSGG